MKKQIKAVVVIGVIFDEKKRILITQRNEPTDKNSHKKWQLPGGGMEFGEHPSDALIREIQEETGLTIESLVEHPLVYSEFYEDRNVHLLFLIYPCRILHGTLDISRDDETIDAKWCFPDQIDFKHTLIHTEKIIKDMLSYLSKDSGLE